MDLRFGLRMLLKTPAFTAVAVLSLALGIGANTAIFTLINSVLLKMLPVPNPEELVAVSDPRANGVSIGISRGVRGNLTTREFEGLRRNASVFGGLFASQSQSDRRDVEIGGKPPEPVRTRIVSAEYFDVLKTAMSAGRAFTAADDRGPGSAPYAVASYAFWQRRFGGSSAAFEQPVRIGNDTVRIIGIAESRFHGESVGEAPDLWLPLNMQPQLMPGRAWLRDDPERPSEKVMWLHVMGRLKPGVSLRQAQANVDIAFAQVLAEEFSSLPEAERKDTLRQSVKLSAASTGVSTVRGDFAEPLYVLMAIVAMVLLIACANVANLLLARATARQKEIGIRIAMGAQRARVIRQFLAESILLATIGGIVGIAFAYGGVRALLRLTQNGTDAVPLDVTPDWRVLLFSVALSLVTGLIFGLAPAWRSSRVNVSGTLKEAGRGMTGSQSRLGLGKSLVVIQIAVSVVLLVGAGWFVRTLRNLQAVDLGYKRENLVVVSVDPLSAGYKGARLAALYRDLETRLRGIPGVRAVAWSENGLFSGSESGDLIEVEGFHPAKKGDDNARFDVIGPNYFSSLGIPVLLGREIGPQDNETSPRVCMVNEAFAKFYFGKASPIGKHVKDMFPDTRVTMEIVGVTADVRDHGLRSDIPRRFYIPALRPMGKEFPPSMNYELRTAGEAAGVIQAARGVIRQINPAISIGSAKPLDELIDRRLSQEKLIARLSGGFGVLALLLACIGLYGVLSYGVAQRTNEIGIRMALGAEQGRVVRMVLRETSVLLFIGLVVGIPASLACARLVQSRLYGLKAADPLTLATAIGILGAVAVFAGYLPARRASKVDPLVALRYE
ncbi:MAG: permease [Bryobacterales bacterium]|nr:permease [Bryobacterales bacterium]